MLTTDELYEGFSKGQAYRKEAIVNYGADEVEASENNLRQRGKAGFEQLNADVGVSSPGPDQLCRTTTNCPPLPKHSGILGRVGLCRKGYESRLQRTGATVCR